MLIFSPFWLAFSLYQVEKEITKINCKEKLLHIVDKNDLTILKFLKNDIDTKLNWEDSNEFEYSEKMYDIVDQEILNDSVVYYCWQDNIDTDLKKRFSAFLKSSLEKIPNAKKLFQQMISISSLNYYLQFHYGNFDDSGTHNKFYQNILNNYQSLNSSPSPPPPQC